MPCKTADTDIPFGKRYNEMDRRRRAGPAGLRKKGDPDVRTVRCRTRNRTPAYGGGADAFLAGYGQDGRIPVAASLVGLLF